MKRNRPVDLDTIDLLEIRKIIRNGSLSFEFNELLEHEQLVIECFGIVNGCGGKGGFIPIPEFHFKHCCNCHDFDYLRGGNSNDRKKFDIKFKNRMIKSVSLQYKGIMKIVNMIIVYGYFIAVRLFGHKFFNYITEAKC